MHAASMTLLFVGLQSFVKRAFTCPEQCCIVTVDGEEAVDSRPMDSCIVVVTI